MADMMTNLLCFFVLLVSIASFDVSKLQAVSQSMEYAMGGEDESAVFDEDMEAEHDMQQTIQLIMQDLKVLFEDQKEYIELEYRKNAVAINLKGSGFFQPGRPEFTEKAYPILEKVGDMILGIPFPVTVEGHTDNIPSNSSEFPSNWELSGARAASVARYLLENGLSPDLLKIVGRADTMPIGSNDTNAGREANRRIVIIVAPS